MNSIYQVKLFKAIEGLKNYNQYLVDKKGENADTKKFDEIINSIIDFYNHTATLLESKKADENRIVEEKASNKDMLERFKAICSFMLIDISELITYDTEFLKMVARDYFKNGYPLHTGAPIHYHELKSRYQSFLVLKDMFLTSIATYKAFNDTIIKNSIEQNFPFLKEYLFNNRDLKYLSYDIINNFNQAYN